MDRDLNNCQVAVVQMNSHHLVADNLQQLKMLIEELIVKDSDSNQSSFDILMLPENFAHMPRNEQERTSCAEQIGSGQIQSFLQALAQKYECWIVAGSVPILVDTMNPESKIYQSCLVYDQTGKLRHRYDKVHLFDVTLPNGEAYEESRYIEFGDVNQDSTVVTPWGRLGLSICYDVRFPEFYRAMNDDVFLVSIPAAFTQKSGEAHWEILLRARAVENQVYVAAAAQTGDHSNGRATWGHSMVVDPWGKVVSQLKNEQKITLANINLEYIKQVRQQFPCLLHKHT